MIRRAKWVVCQLLVVVLLGSGAAAAAGGDGFTTRFVTVPAADGVGLGAMVLEPRAPGPHPVAVLISAWGGGATQNVIPAKNLADRGYLVVAYGARGFGESGGAVEVAGAADIADVSTVIDWALANTAADPARVGVGGVSYGAGIGLIAAGADARIRAVASLSGWADLAESLSQNETRHGLAGLVLYLSGKANGTLSAETEKMLTKFLTPHLSDADSEAIIEWSKPRSAVSHLDRINANHPAVLTIQTWSETVFPPDQMVALYQSLTGAKRAEFVPGDHASSESGGLLGLPSETWNSVYRWFDAHVAGTDDSITREDPIVTRARPGTQEPETHPDWASAVGRPSRWELPPAEFTLGRDTPANGGVPLATYSLEALTGDPPTAFLPLVSRRDAAIWQQAPRATPMRIRGALQARFTVTPPARTGTVVAYVYDVDQFGVGRLINYLPYSWKDAEPGRPLRIDLAFAPTAYTVPAGHRVALVTDSKDPLFLDWNLEEGELAFSGPSWLDIPTKGSQG
ncbi:CocE/NonD family hydrolase [Amycolatopsis magusensis]|uniref:CocE/NonD family hydrolase n=1 Tax=Amycolatopsis magusensis TaxID=882444 RepID=UPI0037930E33